MSHKDSIDLNRKATDPSNKEIKLIDCRKSLANSNNGLEYNKRNEDTMLIPNTIREDCSSEPYREIEEIIGNNDQYLNNDQLISH